MTSWNTSNPPPEPSADLALFLDFDGTLIDIADAPDRVIVPETLPPLLMEVRDILQGALAIVSGRTIASLMRLLTPADLILAGEHGALIRRSGAQTAALSPLWPTDWKPRLAAFARRWPGVEIEEKIGGLGIHFRLAPAAGTQARQIADDLARESGGVFSVLPAKMAYELRRPSADKGSAVRELMAAPPFQGRRPVFVGDDVTDQDGFAAVEQLGGIALHVETNFAGQPVHVRDWLHGFRALQERKMG
jgi:trehalose 6-phosphate phosphatase